jgi:cytochrome P450
MFREHPISNTNLLPALCSALILAKDQHANLRIVYTDATILSRLRAELPSTDATDPTLSMLERLPYLTAVIMEGLRLGPGNATRMARIAHDRDLFYANWQIPAGTPVGMTTILMHMDEKLYPDPERFQPERWMDVEVRKKADKTFAPFSRGTRNCGGMQYVSSCFLSFLSARDHW